MDSLNRLTAIAIAAALLDSCRPATSADEEQKNFQAVRTYWEWGNYWDTLGLDFPGASYEPGLSFEATVFFSAPGTASFDTQPVWGFCARKLLVCQAYWAARDGSISHSTHTMLRVRESAEQAFERFRRQGFIDSAEPRPAGGLVLVPPAPNPPGHSLTPSESSSGVMGVQRKLLTLAALGIPEATRLRRRNQFVESWVRSLGPSSDCRTTVPFADERSVVVPVLTECIGEMSIMNMRREGDEWVATPGGWIRLQKSGQEPVEGRIRRHASLIVGSTGAIHER